MKSVLKSIAVFRDARSFFDCVQNLLVKPQIFKRNFFRLFNLFVFVHKCIPKATKKPLKHAKRPKIAVKMKVPSAP